MKMEHSFPNKKHELLNMTKSSYTKNDVYTCKVCNKVCQMWNKSRHNKSKQHNFLKFCKKMMKDLIQELQLKSNN